MSSPQPAERTHARALLRAVTLLVAVAEIICIGIEGYVDWVRLIIVREVSSSVFPSVTLYLFASSNTSTIDLCTGSLDRAHHYPDEYQPPPPPGVSHRL